MHTTLSDLVCKDKKAYTQYRNLKNICVHSLKNSYDVFGTYSLPSPNSSSYPPPTLCIPRGNGLGKGQRKQYYTKLRGRANKTFFFKLLIKNAINTSHLAISFLSGSAE